MHYFKKLTLTCLIASFSFSVVVAESKEALLKKQKIEEAKSNLAIKGLGVLVALGVSALIFNVDALKDSGLNIGLSAAAGLYGLSCICDNENSVALTQMAIAAPIITSIGTAVMSDAFAGKNGFLAHCPAFGIDRIAQSGQAKSSAFAALSVLGVYRAAQPSIDKVTKVIGRRLPITGRHFKEAEETK